MCVFVCVCVCIKSKPANTVYVVEGITELPDDYIVFAQVLDDSHFWQSSVVGDTGILHMGMQWSISLSISLIILVP